jgi:CRP-like cAMP-binding protein
MINLENKMYADIEYLGNAEGFLDDILENIDEIKLFEGFNTDEIKVLSHHMQCYAAPRDYSLIEEGGEGNFLLLVLTGSVNIVKIVPGHGVKQIAEVGTGVTLGELSLIDGRPRFATCITSAPTDFAVLTRDSLNELLIHYPRLANKFLLVLLKIMTIRMRETSDRFLPFVFSTVP